MEDEKKGEKKGESRRELILSTAFLGSSLHFEQRVSERVLQFSEGHLLSSLSLPILLFPLSHLTISSAIS